MTRLRFLHISDTHIHTDTTYNKAYAAYTPLRGAQALVRAIQRLPYRPDFILHTGDVAYDPFPEVYPAIRDLFAPLKMPIHYLVGNHDHANALQQVLMGRRHGAIQNEVYYDFEVHGVQVVCLDSNGAHDPEKPTGALSQAQLDYLTAICRQERQDPLVIAIHHNVLPAQVPWLDTWMRLENGETFHAIVKQAHTRICGVFHGHIHQTVQVVRDGIPYISAGSSWCQFASYPDSSNEQLVYDLQARPTFNQVTISDDGTLSVINHAFDIDDAQAT